MAEHPQPGRQSLLSHWSRVSLRAKGVAALLVPLTALFAALFSIYWVESAARDADSTVVRAYEARSALLRFHISLLDANSAVSSYLAGGEAPRLAAFEAARLSVALALRDLEANVDGDSASMATLVEMRRAAGEQMDSLNRLREVEPAARPPLSERVRSLMQDAQARIGVMNQAQDLRLFRARYNRDVARQKLFKVVLVCGILGPLGALFVHLLLTGRTVRRLQLVGENARRLAHGLPLDPFPPGNDEIADLAAQLEEAVHLLRERERKLRKSELRYRELFDHAPIPYAEIDRDGVVRRFNAAMCELLKCSPEKLMGGMAWAPVDPERREPFRSALLERMAAGIETEPFECDCVLSDDSRITVEIRENLIRDENGQVTGVCRSMMDVTERNLAAIAARKVSQYAMELRNKNEQLARALEAARSAAIAKGRFLAGVSHELRTPLNGIIGFSELLHDEKLGPVPEEQRDCLADILNSGRHLLHLINDVLDLSKVEAGKMAFRPERCHIGELITEVRDVVWPLADKKGIQIALVIPDTLSASIDPARFKQILYNYLSNAVKFTHDGGHVEVRASTEGSGMFRLEVEDNGIGIAAEEVPMLFQEFQQLTNNRKAEQGTGLGLALTRRIVEAQGGYVGVDSVLGQGSIFSAVLPLTPAGIAAAAGAS
jgi:PAS domain S-box-containing protein